MKKIVFSVLIVFLAAITVLAVSQWNNITALIDGLRYDEQELEQKAVTTEETVNEYLESNNMNKITPMTPEQEQALQNGEITAEDAVKVMTGSMTFEQAKEKTAKAKETVSVEDEQSSAVAQTKASEEMPKPQTPRTQKNEETGSQRVSEEAETEQKDSSKEPASLPEKDSQQESAEDETVGQDGNESSDETVDYDVLISEKVAQLYVVKSNFYSSFYAKWAEQKALFLQLPLEERTRARRAEFVKQCIPQGVAMEKECDAQVSVIIDELQVLLEKAGRDDSLVSAIKNAYNEEKKTMKARLINKYF